MREPAARRKYGPIVMYHLGGKTDVWLSNNCAESSGGGIDCSQNGIVPLFRARLGEHEQRAWYVESYSLPPPPHLTYPSTINRTAILAVVNCISFWGSFLSSLLMLPFTCLGMKN